MLWQFLGLLVIHYFADFVLQTHWQASNKSKSNYALSCHVLTYTSILLAWSVGAFGVFGASWQQIGWFVLANGILHFATDWCTSRVSSRLFMAQFASMDIVLAPTLTGPVTVRTEARIVMKPNFTLHNFFIVVGVDQLIHQLTLAGTMIYFFGGN